MIISLLTQESSMHVSEYLVIKGLWRKTGHFVLPKIILAVWAHYFRHTPPWDKDFTKLNSKTASLIARQGLDCTKWHWVVHH